MKRLFFDLEEKRKGKGRAINYEFLKTKLQARITISSIKIRKESNYKIFYLDIFERRRFLRRNDSEKITKRSFFDIEKRKEKGKERRSTIFENETSGSDNNFLDYNLQRI